MSILKDLRIYFNKRRLIPRAPRQWIIDKSDIPGCTRNELRMIQAGKARNASEARKLLQGRPAGDVLAEMPAPKINRTKRLERLIMRFQNARGVKVGYKPEMRIPIRARYREKKTPH